MEPYVPSVVSRFWAKVQKTDDCWLWTGKPNPDGYGLLWVSTRMINAHVVSYQIHVGMVPKGMQVDHTCHVRNCVNPAHLRVVTRKQNQENRDGVGANNTSGYRGVSLDKRTGKWRAQVGHEGKMLSAGYYETPELANEAAIAKRLTLFTHNELDRHETV